MDTIKLNKKQTILIANVVKKSNPAITSIDELQEKITLLLSNQDTREDICLDAKELNIKTIKTKCGKIVLNKSEIDETILSLEKLWDVPSRLTSKEVNKMIKQQSEFNGGK